MKTEHEQSDNKALNKTDVSGSSIHMNTFRQELIDLYLQGWLDKDWGIGQDEADEKAEMYADQIMKKYKL